LQDLLFQSIPAVNVHSIFPHFVARLLDIDTEPTCATGNDLYFIIQTLMHLQLIASVNCCGQMLC